MQIFSVKVIDLYILIDASILTRIIIIQLYNDFNFISNNDYDKIAKIHNNLSII